MSCPILRDARSHIVLCSISDIAPYPTVPMSDHLTPLARHSVLLELRKDWLAQCQDNVTQWCGWLDLAVGQYYKVATCVYCHKLVPILI